MKDWKERFFIAMKSSVVIAITMIMAIIAMLIHFGRNV